MLIIISILLTMLLYSKVDSLKSKVHVQ